MQNTQLIVIEQLPIIAQQLETLSEHIKEKVDFALSLVVNDDTVEEVKKVRTDLNKEFEALDKQRKEIKAAIIAPYNELEGIFKEFVSSHYKGADEQLKARINAVEDEFKQAKQNDLKEYFDELCTANNIDQMGLTEKAWQIHNPNITLSASLKSLKEKAKEFIACMVDDIFAVEGMEYSAEIMAEYKQNLSLSIAMNTVNARHKAIEDERRRAEEAAVIKQAQEKAIAKVEAAMPASSPLAPPTITSSPDDDPVMTMVVRGSFTTRKSELKEIKKFLEERSFKYEQ